MYDISQSLAPSSQSHLADEQLWHGFSQLLVANTQSPIPDTQSPDE
jgi:hypothetical protein